MRAKENTYYIVDKEVTGSLLRGQEIATNRDIEVFYEYKEYLQKCKEYDIEPVEQLPPEKIPDKITALQARLKLEEWGELEAVEAIINTDEKLKVIWEYVSFLLIYSPMVRQIKDTLGWDENKLKKFFKEASEIVI